MIDVNGAWTMFVNSAATAFWGLTFSFVGVCGLTALVGASGGKAPTSPRGAVKLFGSQPIE